MGPHRPPRRPLRQRLLPPAVPRPRLRRDRVVTSDHDIFDRALLVRRRDRVAADAAAHEFLLARVADDSVERLAAIQRRFPVALDLGAYHGLVGRRLRQVPGVEMVIEAEAAAAPARAVRRPRACGPTRRRCPSATSRSISSCRACRCTSSTTCRARWCRSAAPEARRAAARRPARRQHADRAQERASWRPRRRWRAARARALPRSPTCRTWAALLQRASSRCRWSTPTRSPSPIRRAGADARAEGHGGRQRAGARRRRRRCAAPPCCASLEIYQERFGLPDGRVPATFEIVTLTAWAPHESQQQPLQPGTAKMRLADALGTIEQPAGDTATPLPRRR